MLTISKLNLQSTASSKNCLQLLVLLLKKVGNIIAVPRFGCLEWGDLVSGVSHIQPCAVLGQRLNDIQPPVERCSPRRRGTVLFISTVARLVLCKQRDYIECLFVILVGTCLNLSVACIIATQLSIYISVISSSRYTGPDLRYTSTHAHAHAHARTHTHTHTSSRSQYAVELLLY